MASFTDVLLARNVIFSSGRKDCVTSQKNVCVGGQELKTLACGLCVTLHFFFFYTSYVEQNQAKAFSYCFKIHKYKGKGFAIKGRSLTSGMNDLKEIRHGDFADFWSKLF